MEPARRALLARCLPRLAALVPDPRRLLVLLEERGALSARERRELETAAAGAGVGLPVLERLLHILSLKEQDTYGDLRAALETTEPGALRELQREEEQEECDAGSTYSVLSAMPSDSESSDSLSSIGAAVKAPSPPPALIDQRQTSDKLEAVLHQLRQVTRERDELRKRLALSSPGSTFDDCRPVLKPSPDYERLKVQCSKAMSDLQSLQNQHTKTLKRCEEVAKEADFYHSLHSRLLSDHSQLKDDSETFKMKNVQLLREHNHLKQNTDELKRLLAESQKEILDLRNQQQQVSDGAPIFNEKKSGKVQHCIDYRELNDVPMKNQYPLPLIRDHTAKISSSQWLSKLDLLGVNMVIKQNGSSEILNKLYDTAMDKLEVVKKDYETLRKRYNEKIAAHNTDLSRLEQVEDENRCLQKQMDTLVKQRDTAILFQQQYSSSLRR